MPDAQRLYFNEIGRVIGRTLRMLNDEERGRTVYLPADRRAIKIHNILQRERLLKNRYEKKTTT